jgi:CRISPR type I-E-associated protein CasB/Cse2
MSDAARTAADQLLHGLYALLDEHNRGRLAALRRGLGRPVATPGDAAREFYRLLPAGASARDETAYWTATTLFATFPPRDGANVATGASVGKALRLLGDQHGGEDGLARVERRMLQLLAARSPALPTHLRAAAALLHAAGIVLDPASLVRDLRWWQAPDHRVQQRWARDFWRVSDKPHETSPKEEK